jgi:hypothetical protein
LVFGATQVPKAGSRNAIERKIVLTMDFNIHGAVMNAAIPVMLARRERVAIPGNQLTLDQQLNRTRSNPIVLFDDEARRGFMVSELTVALQMIHSALNARNLEARFRRQIPCAEASADCGQAAYDGDTERARPPSTL